MSRASLVERFCAWLAGLLFLAASRLDDTYDVWLDKAEPRHPERFR